MRRLISSVISFLAISAVISSFSFVFGEEAGLSSKVEDLKKKLDEYRAIEKPDKPTSLPKWESTGGKSESLKKQSEADPALVNEIVAIFEQNPEFADGFVDKQENARWLLDNAFEYPLAADALFDWHDKNPGDTASAWIYDYALTRLAISAAQEPGLAADVDSFLKDAKGADGDVLSPDSIGRICKESAKYKSLSEFIAGYAKRHTEAPFVIASFSSVKAMIIEQNKKYIADMQERFKSCKSNEEFTALLAKASEQIKKDLGAAFLPANDIDKEVKTFETKAKKDFKEVLDKLKVVLAKMKKEEEKIQDAFLDQMEKDREEFRKGLIRSFEDELEIMAAMDEYDMLIGSNFLDLCAEIKVKQADIDAWQKGNRPKPDGKLSKVQKDDIRSRLTPPDPLKKKVIVAADPEPDPATPPAQAQAGAPQAVGQPVPPPVAGQPGVPQRGAAVQPPAQAAAVVPPPQGQPDNQPAPVVANGTDPSAGGEAANGEADPGKAGIDPIFGTDPSKRKTLTSQDSAEAFEKLKKVVSAIKAKAKK